MIGELPVYYGGDYKKYSRTPIKRPPMANRNLVGIVLDQVCTYLFLDLAVSRGDREPFVSMLLDRSATLYVGSAFS